MKISKNVLSILSVMMVFATILTSCGNTSTGRTNEVEGVKWNVAAYAVVPFDSIKLEGADKEAFRKVLPLRYSYTREESAKLDQLLKQNDSLLSAQGRVYKWVKYGEPEKMDLVIITGTPLLEQDVEVTEVNQLPPEYGNNLQVGFRFNDRRLWEEITTANIGKRIAISVNGRVLNAPQVNSPITQGACTVTLPLEEAPTLLPNMDLSKSGK